MKYTLLTGATGFLGHYLFRELSDSRTRLALLVRPSQNSSAAERVVEIQQTWLEQFGERIPSPVVLSGEITRPNCGLSAENISWLKTNCDTVIHAAANVTFQANDMTGEPWETNVNGTMNLLAICEKTGIHDFHYVSTAYVCGLRSDVVAEAPVSPSATTFRNKYERSKCVAEELIRNASFLNEPTIYRPPFIAGDSQSGFTTSYHGLFHHLRLIALIVGQQAPDADGVRRIDFRLPCSGDESRNCVPVDWASKVISKIVNSPEAHGRTYHLTAGAGISAKQIIDYASSYYNSTGVSYGPSNTHTQTELEQMAADYLEAYSPYAGNDPIFDTANLLTFAGDIDCPTIDEAMVHRFIDFGEKNRWRKQRPTRRQSPTNSLELQVAPEPETVGEKIS